MRLGVEHRPLRVSYFVHVFGSDECQLGKFTRTSHPNLTVNAMLGWGEPQKCASNHGLLSR